VSAVPVVLFPLGDGRYELRAFSDDSEDPIILTLDEQDGRRLKQALGEVLSALDQRGSAPATVAVTVGGREVRLDTTADGVRMTVAR
jgi:hypothetical protein